MILRKPYNPQGDIYDQTLGLIPNYDLQARFIERNIISRFNHATSILDVGCGTGQLLYRLEKSKYQNKLIGLDISPEMLRVAKRRCGESVSFINAEAADYFSYTNDSYDIIIMFFNFVQKFRSNEKLACFLNDVSSALNPGGIIVFDWHNKNTVRLKFPPKAVTSLRLIHSDQKGWTHCSITAVHKDLYRLLKCRFIIYRNCKKEVKLTTNHRLLELSEDAISKITLRSKLRVLTHFNAYSDVPFNRETTWRGASILFRNWPVDELVSNLTAELSALGIYLKNLSPIGSFARLPRGKLGADIDVLLVVARKIKSIHINGIQAACKSVAKKFGLKYCEFRHGPFKQINERQLHVILHTEETILRIPLVVRLTWLASGGLSLNSSILFRKWPSKEEVRLSALSNNRKMVRDINQGRVTFREWAESPVPKLISKYINAATPMIKQGVMRFFVRASISDLAVTIGEDPYRIKWISKILSQKTQMTVSRAIASNSSVGYEETLNLLNEVRSHLEVA